MPYKHKDERKKRRKEKRKKSKLKKKSKKHKKEKSRSKYSSSSSEDSSVDFEKEKVNEKSVFKDEDSKQPGWNLLDTVLDSSIPVSRSTKTKTSESSILEKPGQSDRELNPYWKNGGCGLPPANVKEKERQLEDDDKILRSSIFQGSSFNREENMKDQIELFKDKRKQLNFLKPNEETHYQIKSNIYQGNWKKKNLKISDNANAEVKAKSFAKDCSNEKQASTSKTLSNDELNSLAAQLVKAEIMGNKVLIEKYKAQLDAAKQQMEKDSTVTKDTAGKTDNVIILPGRSAKKAFDEPNNFSVKKHKISTHNSKERVCYFPDDDKYSLKNLFEKEKTECEDEVLFMKLNKSQLKDPDEFCDAYLEKAASKKLIQKSEERKDKISKSKAISNHKALEGCIWCLDNRNLTKHLIVSTGEKCYVSLPEVESLTKGHCIIVPLQHEKSTRQLDEDVWEEIKTYKQALAKMFLNEGQDVVFFEIAKAFKHFPHCFIQCIPLNKEQGDIVAMCFQKALAECETEWSHNKKVVDFRNKDLHKAIPKDLPYFAVSFGTEGGFAHIIEDERLFPKNFAEEILGNMMDLNPKQWRNPRKENFKTQRDKALEFLKIWRKFEFNKSVSEESSESDSSSD